MVITLQDAQSAERSAPLRIKFAGLTQRGDLVPDALDEYQQFFTWLPEGWQAVRLGDIETRTEYMRPAWHISGGQLDLVAVEHETGIELILIGVATAILSDAAKGFIKWAWARWQNLRAGSAIPKEPASLVIEVPRDDSSLPPIRLVIPPPVSDNDLARYIRLALASS